MSKFHAFTKTGDIVTSFPGATKLFKEHKIDFCCGGNRPIGEVLEEKQLPVTTILQQLNDMMYTRDQEADLTNWQVSPYGELVHFITDKYHRATREILGELEIFVTKVTRVHGEHHPHLKTIHSLFFQLKEELETHLADEEAGIFPHIVEFEKTKSPEALQQAKTMIEKLEADHDGAGELLRQIREAASDYQVPEDACKTYQLTYLKLEELETMTFEHVHLENNILFPRIMEA